MTFAIKHVNGWRFRMLILSIVVAAVGYLLFSLWGGWQDVVGAFLRIGCTGTLLVLGMSLVNYGLRFVRWQIYLAQLGHSVDVLASLRIYLAGFALTTTPGKAGEAFRGFLLKQRGVPFPTTLATLLSERLSDLVGVVLIAMVGLAQYPEARPIVFAGVAGIAFVLIGLSSKKLVDKLKKWGAAKQGRLTGLIVHVSNMLAGARRCHSPGLVLFSTLLSLIAWGAEALAFYWVLDWLDAGISPSFAFFVYALSMLAGALSFLPGGLGGSEAVMVSLLVFKGMAVPGAVAATVFIRLATLWFAVLIGLVALFYSRNGEGVTKEAPI